MRRLKWAVEVAALTIVVSALVAGWLLRFAEIRHDYKDRGAG